jgi:transcriptional regulator with XRE-family HTH domain
MAHVKRRKNTPESMGERIAEARVTRRKITQKELAAEVGLETLSISRIERGTRRPSDIVLHRLASALGCSVAYLTGEAHTYEDMAGNGAKGEVMASIDFKNAPQAVKVWFSKLEANHSVFRWFVALQLGIQLYEMGLLPEVDQG